MTRKYHIQVIGFKERDLVTAVDFTIDSGMIWFTDKDEKLIAVYPAERSVIYKIEEVVETLPTDPKRNSR